MAEGDFILDGLRFGSHESGNKVIVLEGGLDYGSVEVRHQDKPNPFFDRTMFGQDYLSGPEWQFTLGFSTEDESAWSRAQEFARAWRGDVARSTPNGRSLLTFERGGEVYQVWGRPRKFALSAGNIDNANFRIANATFQCWSAEYQSAQETRLVLTLPRADTTGGLILPSEAPLILGNSTRQTNSSAASVGGTVPATFKVTIKGPTNGAIQNAKVSGPGWSLTCTRPIGVGSVVVIDTALARCTLNGVDDPSLISARESLTPTLKPGVTTLRFDGVDDSLTSTATVAWNDTLAF